MPSLPRVHTWKPLPLLVALVILLAPTLAPSAGAAEPQTEPSGTHFVSDAHVDLRGALPSLNVTLAFDNTVNWAPSVRWSWLIPEGATYTVTDEAGNPLPDTLTPDGYSEVADPCTGNTPAVCRILWRIVLPPATALSGAFSTLTLSMAGHSSQTIRVTVTPPPGKAWLDASPSKDALAAFTGPRLTTLLFGPDTATERRTPVPAGADVAAGLVQLYHLDVRGPGDASLTITHLRNTSVWNPLTHGRIPDGWRFVGAEDAWGPLDVTHTVDNGYTVTPRDVRDRITEARIHLAPLTTDATHPLATVSVPAPTPQLQSYLNVTLTPGAEGLVTLSKPYLADGTWHPSTKGLHATVDKGFGWTVARHGPFVVYAQNASNAAFTQLAGTRALDPTALAFERAGFTLRHQIPLVLLPDGHPSWKNGWEAGHFVGAGWGIELKDSHMGNLSRDGDAWGAAALLLHETFHVGQRDLAPGLDTTWWIEGSADEALRAFPQEAMCVGTKFRGMDCVESSLPTLEQVQRFENGSFTLTWTGEADLPDPAFHYAISTYLVKAYRDRAGEAAYHAVWQDAATRAGCCTPGDLMAVLLDHAPSLDQARIEGPYLELRSDPATYEAVRDAALEFTAWPASTAPTVPPLEASFTLAPAMPRTTDLLRFNDTSLPGSGIVRWTWEFGDGATTEGPNVTHRYASPGDYMVRLRVTDTRGETNVTTRTVTVANAPPVAAFTFAPATPDLRPVQFTTQATDPDGTVVSHAWAFGDGATSTLASPTHTYPASGVYQVRLTVTDDRGATHETVRPVTVANAPPVAQFTVTATEGSTLDLFGFTDASTDTDDGILSWSWAFGDGNASTTRNPVHRFGSPGTYAVTLTVTDREGATAAFTRQVTVTNRAPVADFSGPVAGIVGDALAFTDRSADADGGIVAWSWDFGDGTPPATTPNATHTYTSVGTYLVRLTVTDTLGEARSFTRELVVAAAAPEPGDGDGDPTTTGGGSGGSFGTPAPGAALAGLAAAGAAVALGLARRRRG